MGLEYLFRGRCKWGKFKDNEALFVKTKTGQKIIIFAGGAKADSYKKIRGNSYGMWIATEINLHHDNTIKEAFNRQLMADRRKIFWDLNPSPPGADIYTEYIDNYAKKQEKGEFVGGYNYSHFTIFDNAALTKQRIKEIISQYDKNSIWYQRDIEGKRVIAEGLIYRQFADSPNKYLIDKVPLRLMQIIVGVDFGGNKSKHAFTATGITQGYKEVIALASERHEAKDVSPNKLNELFIKFLKRIISMYGRVDICYVDNAEQTLKNGFKEAAIKAGLRVAIKDALKKEIIDRIRLTSALMATDRFKFTKNCETLVNALSTAVWDPDELDDKRLDDGTSDIDTLDAFEYTIERFMKVFIYS